MTANDSEPLHAEPAEEPAQRPAQAYLAVQLHERSPRCWAVVAEPGGAIVEDDAGALIMRLTAEEAQRMAAAMNAVLKDATSTAMSAALNRILAEADDAALERRAVA